MTMAETIQQYAKRFDIQIPAKINFYQPICCYFYYILKSTYSKDNILCFALIIDIHSILIRPFTAATLGPTIESI